MMSFFITKMTNIFKKGSMVGLVLGLTCMIGAVSLLQAAGQNQFLCVKVGELDVKLKKKGRVVNNGLDIYRFSRGPYKYNNKDIVIDPTNNLEKQIKQELAKLSLEGVKCEYIDCNKQYTQDNFNVIDGHLTNNLGYKKKLLANDFCAYTNKKRDKHIICKKDDDGITAIYHFGKKPILQQKRYFSKLDKDVQDLIFDYAKNKAKKRVNGKKSFLMDNFVALKDGQSFRLFRNADGKLEVKTESIKDFYWDDSIFSMFDQPFKKPYAFETKYKIIKKSNWH